MDEDFAEDLELDLAEHDQEVESEDLAEEQVAFEPNRDRKPNVKEARDDSFIFLEGFINEYKPGALSCYVDLKPKDPSYQLISLNQNISSLLSQDCSDLPSLLRRLNELYLILRNEVVLIHDHMKRVYTKRFDELESLVPNPSQYAEVIYVIEKTRGEEEESLPVKLETDAKLSKEQVLVLMMSMKTSFQRGESLTDYERGQLLQARKTINDIINIQDRVNAYIIRKVSVVAPNLCALVGAEITSLLLSHSGGILELSQVPSCNLASIGKNKHLTHELHTTLNGVRQEGYIYRSSLVQSQPNLYHKQMLRMVCAKVALAARADAAITTVSDSNGSLGEKWRKEIVQKIQKIQDSTSSFVVKPLPVPKDEPKKKRSGRKFRKYKQQFQLSHLRQLQNRLEFGKQEQTVLDAYGEEVGMGMVNSSLQNATGISSITRRNVNNSAKLTKAMRRRIEEANEQTRDYLSSLTTPDK